MPAGEQNPLGCNLAAGRAVTADPSPAPRPMKRNREMNTTFRAPAMAARFNRRTLLASAALSAIGIPAHAQAAWPTKTIRFIVAGPAGGSADIVARMFSEQLSKEVGQPVIVDNKPGAAGGIAI